jgi:hypothetical protein
VPDFVTVSEAARRIGAGVSPKQISTLFYTRKLDDAAAPIIAGRRMIPVEYIDTIKTVLRDAGHLPAEVVNAA